MTHITAKLTTGMVVQLSNGRHEWGADEPLGAGGTDHWSRPLKDCDSLDIRRSTAKTPRPDRPTLPGPQDPGAWRPV
ncbi:MAG: hypothetical protein IID57_09570 [Proteobacteria bacterium]|nr:hypothetical protein [Pseudomonadota bacterium]